MLIHTYTYSSMAMHTYTYLYVLIHKVLLELAADNEQALTAWIALFDMIAQGTQEKARGIVDKINSKHQY